MLSFRIRSNSGVPENAHTVESCDDKESWSSSSGPVVVYLRTGFVERPVLFPTTRGLAVGTGDVLMVRSSICS